MSETTENLLRKWRNAQGLSLEAACELFEKRGFQKPSTAKLSRIERDQAVPAEMISAVEAVTGIPAKEIRPDLAELFGASQ
jgi:transcriptional regulator with XRE-family HTH domain